MIDKKRKNIFPLFLYCLSHRKGLKPIVNAMTNAKEEINRIVAIVKVNSSFMTIKDLKGARASFTGYKSIGAILYVYLYNYIYIKELEYIILSSNYII